MRWVISLVVLFLATTASAQYEAGVYDSIKVNGVWYKSCGGSSDVYWDNILLKPLTFTPSSHTHPQTEITGLTDSVKTKADTSKAGVHKIVAGTNITISGSQGDVTINSTATGGVSIPDSTFAMTEWWIQKNLGALTTIANVGFATAPTARGTATAYQDTFGSFLNYATVAVIDSPGGWRSNIFTEIQLRQAPEITYHIKTGPSATDTNRCVYWIGWLGGDYKRLADSASWNIAAIRYATAADSLDKTFKLVTKAAGAAGVLTVTNTAVPVAPSQEYKITLRAFPNAANTAIDSVVAYINGARVACNTATLPAPATNLGYYCMITAKVAQARAIRIAKIYGRQR